MPREGRVGCFWRGWFDTTTSNSNSHGTQAPSSPLPCMPPTCWDGKRGLHYMGSRRACPWVPYDDVDFTSLSMVPWASSWLIDVVPADNPRSKPFCISQRRGTPPQICIHGSFEGVSHGDGTRGLPSPLRIIINFTIILLTLLPSPLVRKEGTRP